MTDMSLVQQYISVVGGFQGCLLFALLIFDSRVSSASKILGVWCLFFALNFFFPFVVSFEELQMFYPVLGWIFLGNPETYKMLGIYTQGYGDSKKVFRQKVPIRKVIR